MNTSEFDQFADEYNQLHARNIAVTGEKPEFFHEYKLNKLKHFVLERGVAANDILDFGSGIGNSTPFLRRYFSTARLTGADISRRSLEVAESRFPGLSNRLLIEGHHIPAKSNSFDVIFSACVFHHIAHEEHAQWLRELHRVARHGGLLTVFEHNPLNPLTVRAVNTCPFDENAHLIRANQFADRYRQSGWSNPKVRFHLFFPHALSGLRLLEPYLAAVPFGAQYSVTAVK
jgi:ubiquinone/menaquinone biosynthesis C-methylase UbiE